MTYILKHLLIFYALLALIAIILLTTTARGEEKKTIDTAFIAVAGYTVAMTVFDVETTFSALRHGGREANPLMRPFSKNRAYMYPIQLTANAAVLYIAYKHKASKNPNLNKTWWVSPVIMGTSHAVAGGLNLRYCW